MCLEILTSCELHTRTHARTHKLLFNGFCLGLAGNTGRNIHLLTPILIIKHALSVYSVYYDP